jgi:hypothetical protein
MAFGSVRGIEQSQRWQKAMRFMKSLVGANRLVTYFTLAVLAGCASTSVTNRQQVVTGSLPRPGQIWVYPFAATPADIPPESSLYGQAPPTTQPQTAEEIAEGQKLAAAIASQLVAQIQGMGMLAAVGSSATRPQLNDLVIEGSILSVQEGNAAERFAIGFKAGHSEMKAAVEGFQMTAVGLRKLGSGDVGSTGNKTPGAAVGLAVFLATKNPAGLIISTGMKAYGEASGSNTIQGRAIAIAKEVAAALKTRFQEQGWIAP